MARRALWVGLVALGVVATWEAAAVARVLRGVDPGGRDDHATTVGSGPGAPLEVLLLGDSAVDGHGLRVEESLPRQVAARLATRTGRRVRVRSVAVSGATSADVLAFQLPLVRAAGRVDAVVVGVGVNDALQRVRPAAITDATRAIVDGVRAVAPDATLAYVPCHDLTGAPGLGPVLRRVLGWRCRVVARRQLAVLEERAVPVAAVERRPRREGFGGDGLHPGARGVEAIASLVTEALVASSPPAAPP